MFEGWERVQLLEDEDEVVPGLRALWVGVHHRSSMCYLVDTARGPVAISDCVFTYRNLEAGEPLGVQESLEEFHRACARIKRDSALFIPLYEPEVWRRHPGGRVA
jgi:glyoxylase-like metal-dependent hydrolase (beta-lactamase superfamily II)